MGVVLSLINENKMDSDFLESLLHQLVDEETLGVCFELHRAIKLGYYDLIHPDKSSFEKHDVIDEPGLDVFGNSVQSFRKPVECVCPSCQRTLGASKFAPHLEKCLGMGRTSSRLAQKKPQVASVESEGEHSEDNEEDWTYPEKKSKKLKREKSLQFPTSVMPPPTVPATGRNKLPPNKLSGRDGSYQGASVGSIGSAGNISDSLYNTKPSVQQHNAASFSALPTDYKHHLLQQICGVVSERTGRLCTRTIKCPQHSEEDRLEIRRVLLEPTEPVEVGGGSVIHHSSSLNSPHSYHGDSSKDNNKFSEESSHRHSKKKREGSKKHKRTHPTTAY